MKSNKIETDGAKNKLKKRTRIIKWLAILFAIIILIANFSPISYTLHENYTYSNYDGSFTGDEEAGGTGAFKTVRYDYRDWLKAHPDKAQKDSRLYRTFSINPWRFWEWSDYLFCPERFRLPYKTPENRQTTTLSLWDQLWDYF